jgi:acid phosphatase
MIIIHSMLRRSLQVLRAALIMVGFQSAIAQIPNYDHVVVVIMENKAYGQVIGSPSAPYITETARGANTALFTQSFALTHPSQPNYLQLFSGSAQGVKDDRVPAGLPFKSANLGEELIAKGFGFMAYSEDLPSVGFTGATAAEYVRKHAPWVNWQGTGANGIPAAAHFPFSAFPSDYASLPAVAFVVPNLINDMHDGTVAQGDAWIKKNLDGYIQWAKTHNSLFIFTFDEDDGGVNNRIPTFFIGQHVQMGRYNEHITHDTILRTIEDMYSLDHAGAAAAERPITDVWERVTVPVIP